MPPRWRSSARLKAGSPGAAASRGREGSGATRQRVSAALAIGPPARSSSVKTPDCSAASSRRRLVVRSSRAGSPQGSISTAPSAAERAASTPARRTASLSRPRISSSRSGARPSSASPAGYGPPTSKRPASWRIHSTGRAPAARLASPSATSVATGRIALAGAQISCSAARASPPPSQASSTSQPNPTGAAAFLRADGPAAPGSASVAETDRRSARTVSEGGMMKPGSVRVLFF